MNKKCSCCGTIKPLNQFRSRTSSPDGKDIYCKPCYRIKCRLYNHKYRNSIPGKVSCTWDHMTQRALNKNGLNPSYALIEIRMTRAEFISWAIPAYTAWI